jgi:hypothetical protein
MTTEQRAGQFTSQSLIQHWMMKRTAIWFLEAVLTFVNSYLQNNKALRILLQFHNCHYFVRIISTHYLATLTLRQKSVAGTLLRMS